MNTIRLILTMLFLLVSSSVVSSTQEKYALVIGNSNYSVGALDNPVNDAADISAKLKTLGFNVTRLLNAKQREMDTAIRSFTKQLSGENKVGLFYYAGHGIEYAGRNYLVPVDAHIEDEADLKYTTVDAGQILDKMELAGNGLNMVILDACRNNPFKRSFRSATNGLAKMEAPKGSLLMYATSPGDVADDGDGRNGVFTQHFLASLSKPGLKPYEVFTDTASGVIRATQDQQRPYIEGYITGDFYFVPGVNIQIQQAEKSTTSASNTNQQMELAFWRSIESVGTKVAYETYLNKYPNGFYVAAARLKISSFESAKTTNLIGGEWEHWLEGMAKGVFKREYNNSIYWHYQVPKSEDRHYAGINVTVDDLSFESSKLQIQIESETGTSLILRLYLFIEGYSKENDFDSYLQAESELDIKQGNNILTVDIYKLKVPEWWMEEHNHPDIKLSFQDVRVVEFSPDTWEHEASDILKITGLSLLQQ